MAMAPDTPVALPVVSDRAPEEPVVAVPDCTSTDPLFVPPLADAINTPPLDPRPVPESKFTEPPVLAARVDCPANTDTAPPTPVLAEPTDNDIKPVVGPDPTAA